MRRNRTSSFTLILLGLMTAILIMSFADHSRVALANDVTSMRAYCAKRHADEMWDRKTHKYRCIIVVQDGEPQPALYFPTGVPLRPVTSALSSRTSSRI